MAMLVQTLDCPLDCMTDLNISWIASKDPGRSQALVTSRILQSHSSLMKSLCKQLFLHHKVLIPIPLAIIKDKK